jgi:hypothetical protein
MSADATSTSYTVRRLGSRLGHFPTGRCRLRTIGRGRAVAASRDAGRNAINRAHFARYILRRLLHRQRCDGGHSPLHNRNGSGDRADGRCLPVWLHTVNIYPVKGYSITVNLNDSNSQPRAPQVSLLDDATKIVTSRLGSKRFRVAGTAEFNGFNRDIRADRIRPLLRWVEQCFPGVNTRDVIPWAGQRPMMAHMRPMAISSGHFRQRRRT